MISIIYKVVDFEYFNDRIKSDQPMVLLITFLVLFLLFFGWLLLTPITLKIDSLREQFMLRIWGLGKANLVITEEAFLIRVTLAWWSKNFQVFPSKKKKPEEKKPAKTKRKKKKMKWSWRKMIRLLKTFKVKKLRLDLDTDNYILNAYLFPVFHFLRRPNQSVSINFMGRNECQLEVTNRVGKVLLALIRI